MTILPISSNQTELHLDNGTVILFSYQTAVAARVAGEPLPWRTAKHYSVTTSKHINRWLEGGKFRAVSPEELQGLVKQ